MINLNDKLKESIYTNNLIINITDDDYNKKKKLIKILKNKYRYDYNKIMKNESFIWNNIVY